MEGGIKNGEKEKEKYAELFLLFILFSWKEWGDDGRWILDTCSASQKDVPHNHTTQVSSRSRIQLIPLLYLILA